MRGEKLCHKTMLVECQAASKIPIWTCQINIGNLKRAKNYFEKPYGTNVLIYL